MEPVSWLPPRAMRSQAAAEGIPAPESPRSPYSHDDAYWEDYDRSPSVPASPGRDALDEAEESKANLLAVQERLQESLDSEDYLEHCLEKAEMRTAEVEALLQEREASEQQLEHNLLRAENECEVLRTRLHERRLSEEQLQRDLVRAESERESLNKRLGDAEEELERHKRFRPSTQTDVAWANLLHLPRPSQGTAFSMRPLLDGEPVHCLISDLVRRSCTQHRASLRSQDFRPPPQLLITGIAFAMNPVLIGQYHSKAEEIAAHRPLGCTPIAPLSHLKVPADPRVSGPDLNAHLLFHGSHPEAVEHICRNGFDPRRGGEGTGRLFGVATYLAANASKADAYTDPRRDSGGRLPRNAERRLIVARALLGESWRAAQARHTDTRPPDGPDGQPFDSTWADTRTCGGVVDHLEVMLYDKGQAYPEYIVSYRHAPECACAECCKRPAV